MAFTYLQLYDFFEENKEVLKRIFNSVERELIFAYYSVHGEPTSEEVAELVYGVSVRYSRRLNLSATRGVLRKAREKLGIWYRLERDFGIFFQKDSIAYLPTTRPSLVLKLVQNSFFSLEQLRLAKDEELLRISGIGKVAVAEIRRAIRVHDEDISPRPDPDSTKVVKKRAKPRPVLTTAILKSREADKQRREEVRKIRRSQLAFGY